MYEFECTFVTSDGEIKQSFIGPNLYLTFDQVKEFMKTKIPYTSMIKELHMVEKRKGQKRV